MTIPESIRRRVHETQLSCLTYEFGFPMIVFPHALFGVHYLFLTDEQAMRIMERFGGAQTPTPPNPHPTDKTSVAGQQGGKDGQ